MHGQKMIGAKCPDCGSKLPPLRDNHGWEIIDCPKEGCNNWFDTDAYQNAGGKING